MRCVEQSSRQLEVIWLNILCYLLLQEYLTNIRCGDQKSRAALGNLAHSQLSLLWITASRPTGPATHKYLTNTNINTSTNTNTTMNTNIDVNIKSLLESNFILYFFLLQDFWMAPLSLEHNSLDQIFHLNCRYPWNIWNCRTHGRNDLNWCTYIKLHCTVNLSTAVQVFALP